MSNFFIDRPIFAAVISILILLAGLIALGPLPIAQYPQTTPPTIRVSATYPGATPEQVSQSVAIPIEEQVNGAEGMMYMSSSSTNTGQMSLTITFGLDRDPDLAAVELLRVLNSLQAVSAPQPADIGFGIFEFGAVLPNSYNGLHSLAPLLRISHVTLPGNGSLHDV